MKISSTTIFVFLVRHLVTSFSLMLSVLRIPARTFTMNMAHITEFVDTTKSSVIPPTPIPVISLRIYIEHTDAFAVVYNANYPLFIERALAADSPEGSTFSRILGIKTLKYRNPARLGDQIDIFLEKNRSSPGKVNVKLRKSDNELVSAIISSFQRTIQYIEPSVEDSQQDSSNCRFQHRFELWRDELQLQNTLSTKLAFQLFERARTETLGGPSALARLTSQYGVHVYVARVADYRLLCDIPKSIISSDKEVKLTVLTDTEPLGDPAGGTVSMVHFTQRIVSVASTAEPIITHASAVFTCSCVNAATGTPTPFPVEINEFLFGPQYR